MNTTDKIAILDPDAMTWWPGEFTPLTDIDGGAVFGHFQDQHAALPRLAVVYYPDGGDAFTVTDWHGVQPETPADIPLFTWRCGNIDALLFDGRPVLPPWAGWGVNQADAADLFSAMEPATQTVVLNFLHTLDALPAAHRKLILAMVADEMGAGLDDAAVQP